MTRELISEGKSIASVICKFPGALAAGHSPLCRFLTKYLGGLCPKGPGQKRTGGLWPAPRPFDTEVSLLRRPRSGHARDRWNQKRSARIWVNILFGIHSALEIGLCDLDKCSWLVVEGRTQLQKATARDFLDDTLPMCRVAGVQLTRGRVGIDRILANLKDEYRLGSGAL